MHGRTDKYRMIVHGLYKVSTNRIYHSINLEEISLFQDVWKQQFLITAFYYNNLNNFNITLYIDVLIVY